MYNFYRRVRDAIFLAGAIALCTAPAQATPFAGVSNAAWRVSFAYYFDGLFTPTLPDGITISCFGGALAGGNTGCQDHASLIVTDGSNSISKLSGLTVTNSSETDLLGTLLFRTFFSAFNPGGSWIGAQVDDPTTQYAEFSSSVFGPGTGDSHSCNTLTGPNFMGPNACGVFSPDSSDGEFGVGPLGAGQSATRTYQISISARVIGIPEPTTLAIFGIGMIGALAIRRRKSGAV